VRNASNFKAITYTKLELQKVKWAYSDGRENQLDADTRALEVCNKVRSEASEPCRLYDLSTPVSQKTVIAIQHGNKIPALRGFFVDVSF